jgi:hypothetical protein
MVTEAFIQNIKQIISLRFLLITLQFEKEQLRNYALISHLVLVSKKKEFRN